eukprot:1130937-Pleurochrysis_carterae.AAC.1
MSPTALRGSSRLFLRQMKREYDIAYPYTNIGQAVVRNGLSEGLGKEATNTKVKALCSLFLCCYLYWLFIYGSHFNFPIILCEARTPRR